MRTIPAINQPWPEQGGIYIGSRLIDGKVHHIVIPGGTEHDAQGVAFKHIAASIPAEINGHNDWRAPSQEDLMLAWINAREHFVQKGSDSIYWTGTAYNDTWGWAVVFEDGRTSSSDRNHEFRVRPVRSFPDSSL